MTQADSGRGFVSALRLIASVQRVCIQDNLSDDGLGPHPYL